MIYITAVHMTSTAGDHEHIGSVRWSNPNSQNTGTSERQTIVDWINSGGAARVRDRAGHDIAVAVVDASPPYIRTYADNTWTDNLLALPRY